MRSHRFALLMLSLSILLLSWAVRHRIDKLERAVASRQVDTNAGRWGDALRPERRGPF